MVKPCGVYSKYVFQCLEVTWAPEDCGRIGYSLQGHQSCAARASNILLTASFALFCNVLSSI